MCAGVSLLTWVEPAVLALAHGLGGGGSGEVWRPRQARVESARDLLGVALIIGIARGITVIMNNAQITDTILHWIEKSSPTVWWRCAGYRSGSSSCAHG
jgi:hypothetical protein